MKFVDHVERVCNEALTVMIAAAVTVATVVALQSCGQPTEGGGDKPPPQTGNGGASDFASIQPVIQRNCASCHDGSNQKPIDSAARMSAAKAQVRSGKMPPGGRIDPADKAAILSFGS